MLEASSQLVTLPALLKRRVWKTPTGMLLPDMLLFMVQQLC